jgi:hypothetical protein
MIDAGMSVTKVAKIHRTNAAAAARGNSLLIAPLSPLTRHWWQAWCSSAVVELAAV